MSKGATRQEILLETGTNEVEVAEFDLCTHRFGVNVAKVREFIPHKGIAISKLPNRHPSVSGLFLLRGKSIPLVDLEAHLGLPHCDSAGERVVVITEFNNLTTSFVADAINRIHRVSWNEFKPLSRFLADTSPVIIGSINLDGHEVLILDLEHIIGEIFPETVINYDEDSIKRKTRQHDRGQVKIFFAEDSAVIRNQVGKILRSVGYGEVTTFDNGLAAYEALSEVAERVSKEGKALGDFVTVLLSDIEMPQMDGLTLCRRVKTELRLPLPTIMFSSLINEQMARKCKQVGADGFASKPETERLIEIIDSVS